MTHRRGDACIRLRGTGNEVLLCARQVSRFIPPVPLRQFQHRISVWAALIIMLT